MVDATVAAAGGHVDAAVTFLIDAKPMVDAKEVTVIGYTGTKDLDDFKGLSLTNQGIAGVDKLVANYAIFSSREMPNAKAKEIHDILTKSSNNEKVRESYAKDNLMVVNIPLNNSEEWYDAERSYWKSLASKLPKSK
jgi:tripartite-type tricarboxylate transporter receptor subunit TctC